MPYVEFRGGLVEIPEGMSGDEAASIIARDYKPTGEDIAQDISQGHVPTKEEFKTWKEWGKQHQSDWVENLAQGLSGVVETVGKGVVAGATGSAANPLNYVEGVAQGGKQLWGILAQSEDPNSAAFRFKDLITGDGTLDSQYQQFLDAQKFHKELQSGVIVSPELTNKDFVDAVSMVADPTMFIPGIGEALGVGKLASKVAGKTISAVGKGIERVAVPIDSVASKAAEAMAKVTGLNERALSAVGVSSIVGAIPGYASIAAVPAIASAAVDASKVIQGIGESMASGASRIGPLEAAGDVFKPNVAQRILKFVGRSGGDSALDLAVRGTAGAIEGAAVGGALGYWSGGEDGMAQGIGSGLGLGAMGAVASRVGNKVLGKAAIEARANDFEKWVGQFRPELQDGFKDMRARAGLDHASSFADLSDVISHFAGDIPVDFLRDAEAKASGHMNGGRGVVVTDGPQPRILINIDHFGAKGAHDNPLYTLAHEAFEAFAKTKELQDQTLEIQQVIGGIHVPGQDGMLSKVQDGLLSTDELNKRFDEYKAKLSDPSSLDGFNDSQKAQYVAREIAAEHFARLVTGQNPDALLRGFGGMKRDILDRVLLSNTSKRLSELVSGLDKAYGVQPTDSVLFPDLAKASPTLNAMLRTLVRSRLALDEAVTKADNSKIIIKPSDLSNPKVADYAVKMGVAERDATGKVSMLSDEALRVQDEANRNGLFDAIKAGESKSDASQPFARITTNKQGEQIMVGALSKEQVAEIQAHPGIAPRVKETIAMVHKSITDGHSIWAEYVAATKKAVNRLTGKWFSKYSSGIAISFREMLPYSFEISKAGNPFVRALDVSEIRSMATKRLMAGKLGDYNSLGEFMQDFGRYVTNLTQGAAAPHSETLFGKGRAQLLNDFYLTQEKGGSQHIHSFRIDRTIRVEPRDYNHRMSEEAHQFAKVHWMPAEKVGESTVISSQEGVRMIEGKRGWRVYDKDGGLVGIGASQHSAEQIAYKSK